MSKAVKVIVMNRQIRKNISRQQIYRPLRHAAPYRSLKTICSIEKRPGYVAYKFAPYVAR